MTSKKKLILKPEKLYEIHSNMQRFIKTITNYLGNKANFEPGDYVKIINLYSFDSETHFEVPQVLGHGLILGTVDPKQNTNTTMYKILFEGEINYYDTPKIYFI